MMTMKQRLIENASRAMSEAIKEIIRDGKVSGYSLTLAKTTHDELTTLLKRENLSPPGYDVIIIPKFPVMNMEEPE